MNIRAVLKRKQKGIVQPEETCGRGWGAVRQPHRPIPMMVRAFMFMPDDRTTSSVPQKPSWKSTELERG